MVSTRKKNHQNKRQHRQFDETLNDFIVGNITEAEAIGKETLECQTSSFGSSTVVAKPLITLLWLWKMECMTQFRQRWIT